MEEGMERKKILIADDKPSVRLVEKGF